MKTRISFRLEPELKARAEYVGHRTGLAMSDVMTFALARYIDEFVRLHGPIPQEYIDRRAAEIRADEARPRDAKKNDTKGRSRL